MFKVLNLKTGIYIGDPKNTTTFDYEFDGITGFIHRILGSRHRAQTFTLDEAMKMIKADLNLGFVQEPLAFQ